MTEPDPNRADPNQADPSRCRSVAPWRHPIWLAPSPHGWRRLPEPGRDRTHRRGPPPRPALDARRAPRAGRRDHPRAPAAGQSVTVVLDDGRRFPMAHVHQGVFAVTVPDEKVPGYRIAVDVPRRPGRRGRRRGARRPVPAPAHAGRVRPVPDRRGPARGTVARARRARPRGRPGHRHVVRGLGAERPRRPGHRRLQLLGRPRVPDALARRRPASGSCSSRAWPTAPGTSTRSAARTACGGRRPTRWRTPPSSRPPPRRWCTPRGTPGTTTTG